MLFLSLILILPVWIWCLFVIPHILSAAAHAMLTFERELTIFDPPESTEWLLYVPAWVVGSLIAKEITSSLGGFVVMSALVGGSLGGLVRFMVGTTPHSLALLSGLILLFPVLGYVLGAWLTLIVVVPHWYALGTPPAAAVGLVDIDLDQFIVAGQDGRNYTCCTALGGWTSETLESAFVQDVMPCEPSEPGWSCPALGRGEWFDRELTPIPPPPSGTAKLYHFAFENRHPGGWYAYNAYGGVALQADGSVWEWRRMTGSGTLFTPPQFVGRGAASKVLHRGVLSALGGGLFVLVISGALRLRARLRQARRP